MFRLLVLRYLFARQGMASVVTVFSLIGIMLGVGALIVVLSVMAGFRDELTSRILGVTGHAIVSAPGMTTAEAFDLREKLLSVEDVTTAEPYVQGQGMIVANGRALGALVRGVEPTQEDILVAEKTVRGDWQQLSRPGTIAIGDSLSNEIGVGIGGAITLLSPQGTQTAFGFIPRMQRFEVVAIFDVGLFQYDSGVVFTNIQNSQTFFRLGDVVSGIDLRVTRPAEFNVLMPSLIEVTDDKAYIQPWMENNKAFFDALQIERVTMFIILALIVVVAAFNIITGQTMAVNDKRADIAILRTMGATKRRVLSVFFFNGVLIGLLGTILGVLLGFTVLWNLQGIVDGIQALMGVDVFNEQVYFLSDLPTQVVPIDVLWVVAMSVGLSLLASLYPAWMAARTHPVEVLRND